MLDDAPFGGIGAGGFADLAPIYREIADPPSPPTAATAASTLAIELGKPMFWLLSPATVSFAFWLLQASLRRGRDPSYAAMAASTLFAVLLCPLSIRGYSALQRVSYFRRLSDWALLRAKVEPLAAKRWALLRRRCWRL
jgi:hypothetical protein